MNQYFLTRISNNIREIYEKNPTSGHTATPKGASFFTGGNHLADIKLPSHITIR